MFCGCFLDCLNVCVCFLDCLNVLCIFSGLFKCFVSVFLIV